MHVGMIYIRIGASRSTVGQNPDKLDRICISAGYRDRDQLHHCAPNLPLTSVLTTLRPSFSTAHTATRSCISFSSPPSPTYSVCHSIPNFEAYTNLPTMDDDWASEGDEGQGLGDFAIPEISVPDPPPKPPQSPATPPVPPPSAAPTLPVPNAWASANSSSDARLATRLRNAANIRAAPPSAAAATAGVANHRPASSVPVSQSDPRRWPLPTPNDTRSARPVPSLPHMPSPQSSVAVPPPPSSQQQQPQQQQQRTLPMSLPQGASPQRGASAVSVLYVTHLPAEVTEHDVAGFFARCGVSVPDVRITRHSDTGNVKAAFVTVRGEANWEMALALDGAKLMGKSLYVKIDGADRRGATQRDRGYGFGGRDRAETGRAEGMWGERPNSSFDGGSERRDARSKGRGRSFGEQREDPTIPTGPPPAGRKKLMLKPRTKPLPVLEVDKRAIDGPKSSGGVTSSLGNDGNGRGEDFERETRPMSLGRRTGGGGRGGGPASGEKWSTLSREGGSQKGSVTKSSAGKGSVGKGKEWVNKKDDDNKNRPVLLNAFAALEVNDTDV